MWEGPKATMQSAKQPTFHFILIDILGIVLLRSLKSCNRICNLIRGVLVCVPSGAVRSPPSIGAALGASFAMSLYHVDSTLGLNF